MKSLKRLITVVLALAMILTSVGIPAFAANFSDITNENVSTAVDKLVANGIITGYEDGTFKPDNQITRAEFAAIVTRMKGVANNLPKDSKTGFWDLDADDSRAWARPYVKAAVDLKIINGFEDGSFRAAEPVTYEQAVKMLVCAVGYEVVANSEYNKAIAINPNATWSAGYIAAANKHGITRGVMTSLITQPASRGVVAVLTSNGIEVPPLKENENGSFEKDETSGNEQSVIEIEGTVTGTYHTGLTTDHVGIGPKEIIIKNSEGEEKYALTDTLAADFDAHDIIGKYVTAYYDKFEYKITALRTHDYTSTIISEEDVVRPISNIELKYYDSNNSRNNVPLSDYIWIYNGKYVATGSVNLETAFKNGTIELVESAGYKVAKITNYEVFVVNSYNSTTQRFTLKYDKTYDGNNYFQFETIKPEIYVNGKLTSFDSLSLPAYSVVNYMESLDSSGGNKIRKMYVTTGKKSGKVTSKKGTREVEIDNKEYYLTNDYVAYSGSDKAQFNLGDVYNSFYLDHTGQIAAINYNATQSSNYKIGYIIDADRTHVMLVKSDGSISEIELKSNVKVDGNSVSSAEVKGLLELSAPTANAGYNSVFPATAVTGGCAQPVKYSVAGGVVDGIDTVVTGAGGNGDVFVCDAPLSGTSTPTSSRVTINSTTYQVNNATILYVPDDRTAVNEYVSLTASKAFNSTNRYIEIFGSDSGSVIRNAGLVVIYGTDPSLVFEGSTSYMVVTGKSYSGDKVVINGYVNGSKDVTPITIDTEKFKVDTTISVRSKSYDDVDKGDIIRYLGTDSSVKRIEMIYDADDTTKNLNTNNGVSFVDTNGSGKDLYVKYGEVIQNEDGKTFYMTTELGSGDKMAEDKLLTYTISSSTAVYNMMNDELISSNGIDVVSASNPDRVIVISELDPLTGTRSAKIVYVAQ